MRKRCIVVDGTANIHIIFFTLKYFPLIKENWLRKLLNCSHWSCLLSLPFILVPVGNVCVLSVCVYASVCLWCCNLFAPRLLASHVWYVSVYVAECVCLLGCVCERVCVAVYAGVRVFFVCAFLRFYALFCMHQRVIKFRTVRSRKQKPEKNPRRSSCRLPQRVSPTHPSCGQKRLYSQTYPPQRKPFFMLRILQASHLTTHKKHNDCLHLHNTLPTPSRASFCSFTHQNWHIVNYSHVSCELKQFFICFSLFILIFCKTNCLLKLLYLNIQ